jgi:hypothetical protein
MKSNFINKNAGGHLHAVAQHLNDRHLFVDPKQAAEFQLLSNQRVEEHAPFFVFGIYTIPMDSVKRIGKKEPPIL